MLKIIHIGIFSIIGCLIGGMLGDALLHICPEYFALVLMGQDWDSQKNAVLREGAITGACIGAINGAFVTDWRRAKPYGRADNRTRIFVQIGLWALLCVMACACFAAAFAFIFPNLYDSLFGLPLEEGVGSYLPFAFAAGAIWGGYLFTPLHLIWLSMPRRATVTKAQENISENVWPPPPRSTQED